LLKNPFNGTKGGMIATHSCSDACAFSDPVILFASSANLGKKMRRSHAPNSQTGDNALHILSPTLLELVRVNTKQPSPAHVDSGMGGWQREFCPTGHVEPQGGHQWPAQQCNRRWVSKTPSAFMRAGDVGFCELANYLYLQLSNHISMGQSVRVVK